MQLRNRQLGNLEQSEYQVTLQICIADFVVAFRTVGEHKVYGPQTKILEGRTNIPECAFEALFSVC